MEASLCISSLIRICFCSWKQHLQFHEFYGMWDLPEKIQFLLKQNDFMVLIGSSFFNHGKHWNSWRPRLKASSNVEVFWWLLSCGCCLVAKVQERESCSVVSDSLQPHGLYSLWNSPGQNTGVCSLSLLQGISPTHGSNPGLPHCRVILYQLSQKGCPRILELVAYPFSSRFSQPRNRTRVSCIVGKLLTNWAIREALSH